MVSGDDRLSFMLFRVFIYIMRKEREVATRRQPSSPDEVCVGCILVVTKRGNLPL
jgi:hypothetical protein